MGILFVVQGARREAPATASAPEDVAEEKAIEVLPDIAAAPASPASPSSSSAAPASVRGPQPDQWFAAPERDAAGRYVAAELPIDWSGACAPELKRRAGVVAFARATGLRGETQFPRDEHVRELTQFWTEGKLHRQVTIQWQQDEPATYVFESYRSESPDFSSGVTSMAVEGVRRGERVDIERALRVIEATLTDAKARGAREGARILVARANSRKVGEEPFEARFVNGRASEFRGAGFACVAPEGAARAACRCGAGGEE